MIYLKSKKKYLLTAATIFIMIVTLMVGCQEDSIDEQENINSEGITPSSVASKLDQLDYHFVKEIEVKNQFGQKLGEVEILTSDKSLLEEIAKIKLELSVEKQEERTIDEPVQNEITSAKKPDQMTSAKTLDLSKSVKFIVKDHIQKIPDGSIISFKVDLSNTKQMQAITFVHEYPNKVNWGWLKSSNSKSVDWLGFYFGKDCNSSSNTYNDIEHSPYSGQLGIAGFSTGSFTVRKKCKAVVVPGDAVYIVKMQHIFCGASSGDQVEVGCTSTTGRNSYLDQTELENMSLFMDQDLSVLRNEALNIFINHQDEINQLNENAEIQTALDNFWSQNKSIIKAAFGGTNTLVASNSNVQATLDLLNEVEEKTSSKELKEAISVIKSHLHLLVGKDLKEGLKTIDKLELSLSK